MIRKLKLLWRLLNSVEEKDGELIINVDRNIRFSVDGHIFQESTKSCLIKTGTENGHLLYLNPTTEKSLSHNVSEAVQQSSDQHRRSMSQMSAPPTSCNPKEPK